MFEKEGATIPESIDLRSLQERIEAYYREKSKRSGSPGIRAQKTVTNLAKRMRFGFGPGYCDDWFDKEKGERVWELKRLGIQTVLEANKPSDIGGKLTAAQLIAIKEVLNDIVHEQISP